MCLSWREEGTQRGRQRSGGEKSPSEGGSEERGQDLRDERTWRVRTSGFGRSGTEKGVKQSSVWRESSLSATHNYLCSSQFCPSPPTYFLSTSFQFLTLFSLFTFQLVFVSRLKRAVHTRTCTRMHAWARRNDTNRKRRRSEMWEVVEEWKEWKLKSQRRTSGELFNYLVYHCRDAVKEPSVVKPRVWEEGKHTQVRLLYLHDWGSVLYNEICNKTRDLFQTFIYRQ